ncbi:MAG: signal recognition particle-docking protein FtsY [Bdellovibrio sp.]
MGHITGGESNLIFMILGVFAIFLTIFGVLIARSLFLSKEREPAPPVMHPDLAKPATPDDFFESSRTLPQALANTEKSFFGRLKGIFKNEAAEKNFDDIEEVLMTSDLGPQTVGRLMGKLEELGRSQKSDVDALKSTLKTEFLDIFEKAHIPEANHLETLAHLNQKGKPAVWMIVGVNGAGKTTTIGKLSAHLAKQGKRVLVAAGDTFRAAAGAQLKTWTDRAQVDFFSPDRVTDPSAVAYDAVARATSQGYDVVLIDTAGRLHTQVNLMEELKKVKRVLGKINPEAPHETLIVLDANSGQNALHQAREFHQAIGLTGVVLTKMDGTAKGGVAVGLAHELKIPIRLIGIGEKIGDLKPFSASEFVDSILGGG